MSLDEPIVENAVLTWFNALGYAIGYRQRMASGELPKDGMPINTMKGMAYG